MNKNKGRSRFLVLCLAPATILFFIFMIVPTLNVFRMSLFERGAYSPNETFVGLANFQQLFKDTQFIRSMQNMILLVVIVTIITFGFALVFAAILTREKIKGRTSSAWCSTFPTSCLLSLSPVSSRPSISPKTVCSTASSVCSPP